jgi:glutamate synthase domain-containing protein 3
VTSPLASDGPRSPAIISVPEIREFDRINAEIVQRLNHGAKHIVLMGVEGQRLLAFRLMGPWHALIEIEGNPGPEVGAELDAPGLTVVCRGRTAEGAGRAIKNGRLVIHGSTTEALGYTQSGGTILVKGSAGNRAGLNQSGGKLIVLGGVGRLAGEGQRAGLLALPAGKIGSNFGRNHSGGQALLFPLDAAASAEDQATWNDIDRECKALLSIELAATS